MASENCLHSPPLHPVGVSPSSDSITRSPATSSDASHASPPPPGRRVTPIVRVVQIFAPKMIQTDVANFRALVQELTGMSASSDLKGTASSEKPTKRIGNKKRKAARTQATADRQEVGMVPVSAQLLDPARKKQHVEEPRDNALSGAVQNVEGSAFCVQQHVDYAQTTDHHDNECADAKSISYSGACNQDLPISWCSSLENSRYMDQWSLFSSDLDVLSSLNFLSGSNSPELNPFAGLNLPELNQCAPIANACHDYNSVLQQQFSWRLPVSPVFQSAYEQF